MRKQIAVLGSAIAFASAAEMEPTTEAYMSIEEGTIAQQIDSLSSPLAEIVATTVQSSSPAQKSRCTTGRRKPNDIYIAYGCKAEGDTFDPLDNVEPVKGWVPGVMVIDGIYKCVHARLGVLPTKPDLRDDAKRLCQDYLPDMVETGYVFFEKWNCKLEKPCNDARRKEKISKKCPDSTTARNFATDEPSPFNMYGTGEGGFSDSYEDNSRKWTKYRVRVKQPSADGKAIVIRGPKWGFLRAKCYVGKSHRGRPVDDM